jgi:hypothetical protein
LISKPLGSLTNNCRPIHISITSNEAGASFATTMSSGAFARVSIICADPSVPYLGNGTPDTYEVYIANDIADPHSLIQPTIQYQASNALIGTERLRSELNLLQMQNNSDSASSPVGPVTYPYFPYIVRIYAPIAFTASITMQFL